MYVHVLCCSRPPAPAPPLSSSSSTTSAHSDALVIGIYFGSDPIPYRITVNPTPDVFTLGQFKTQLAKRGNFR